MGVKDAPGLSHMVAASMGESMACLVRVPTEVIKAKMQTTSTLTLGKTFEMVLQETHGSALSSITGGLYRVSHAILFLAVAIDKMKIYQCPHPVSFSFGWL